jgi:hypothetical protein
MKTKFKTNEQVIKQLLKELSTFEIAILRERLMTICDLTLKNQDEIQDSFMISKNHFIMIVEKINSIVNPK